MANELSLLVWWLMWAELVYLLTYLQKRNFPYASSSYIMYMLYTQYIPLPTHNVKGSSIDPQITMSSLAATKVTVDPSQGQGVKWLVCLTLQLKKGLKEDDRVTAALSTGWRWDRSSSGPPGQGSEPCNYLLYPLHHPGTAASACSLPAVDATPVLTLHDARWNHRHMVGKQKALFLCVSEPCHMNHSWKYRFFLDHLTPSLGLFSLSSL